MSDFERHLRQRLQDEASALPLHATRVAAVARRARRRQVVMRLGVVAILAVVVAGGLVAFFASRGGDGASEIVVTDETPGPDAAPSPVPTAQAVPTPEATDVPVADEDPTAGAVCYGFDVYCLGAGEDEAVAAGRAAFGPEERGAIYEGEPPDPDTHVWYPGPGVTLRVDVVRGVVAFVDLSQPATTGADPAAELPVFGGVTLNASTLDDVVEILAEPRDVFVGGGEGVDFLLFEYLVDGVDVTYGYAQTWDVGLLERFDGLAPADIVAAARIEQLPVNVFRAEAAVAGIATDETTPLPELALRGWGEVTVGMSEDELLAIGSLQPMDRQEISPGGNCAHRHPLGFPELGFMIVDGVVVRIEVYGGLITTLSGVGVGSTESEVYAAYGDRIVATPHPYLGDAGSYLTFVPADDADRDHRLIFETEDDPAVGEPTVTSFRTGRLPEVEWIEGCA